MTRAPSKPSLLRKFLRWSLLTAGALFAIVIALLIARPEALLFYPAPFVAHTPDEIAWTFEPVTLETPDGEQLSAWFLSADPAQARPAHKDAVILYCHGNGGNMGGRVPTLEGLRALGLSVLIFDYRGYGDSSGRPTVAGTRLDVTAAWDYLIEQRGYAPSQVVLWGRSLGGAIAIDQAARASAQGQPPGALVVESSFTSTVDIGAEVYPWLPVRWLGAKIDYPSRELISQVAAPLLLAHSPSDDLIPAAHGDALREAASAGLPGQTGAKVSFVELDGGHNGGRLSQPRHRDALLAFLDAALPPAAVSTR